MYRSTYAGESIVTELVLSENNWQPETEYVPNRVFNTYTTNQAVAIGNGASREGFDLKLIENHRGGLLATNKLQSYACNMAYKEFTPDFLIATGAENVRNIARSEYPDDHIVYSNAQYVLQYPGKFYLTPQNPAFDAGSLAAYMACFDGHRKVFLLGYDGYGGSSEDTFWIKTLTQVMKTYPETEFVHVGPTKNFRISDELNSYLNFRQTDFRGFVCEADIG